MENIIFLLFDDSNSTLDTLVTIASENGIDCIVPEPTFSPNYDGINETFSPVYGFNGIELFVFNRWGHEYFMNNLLVQSGTEQT